jgi:hypothetical protein
MDMTILPCLWSHGGHYEEQRQMATAGIMFGTKPC